MANDSRIVITAGLDIATTVDEINKDLKKVQNQVNKIIVNAKFDKKVEKDINNLTQALTRLQQLAAVAKDQTIRINAQDNGVTQIVQRLDELARRVDQINQNQLDMRADRAVNEIQNVNTELQTVNINAVNARKSLVDMLGNVGIHLSAYQALRLIREGIQEISDAIKEYDEYVTNLRIITQKPTETVNNMLSQYSEKAMKMGVDISEYEKAAETILRTGKTAEDTDKILRDSVLLSKVGFIDSEKAASNIVTIANAYDLEADSMERVVDSLLSLDTSSMATGGALSTAVARTAKNAQQAGVTLDSLVSRIATLRDVTGKEEEQIATSLNSIYSRMYNVKLGKFVAEDESGVEDITEDISDMEKILGRVGLRLREDKGTFREFDDIIKDLHDNWSKFNDVERSAIAKGIGGLHHRNTAIALIENYEDFQRLQDISLNSAGTAAERYTAYTDSIAAKSAELNTALKQMWSNTISGETVKDIKEASTELVQFIDKYEILQNLLKTGLIYGAAKGFIYLSGTVHDAYISMRSLSQAFNALTMMKQNAYGTTGYNTAVNSLMVSAKGLTDAQVKLLFSTNQLSQAQMLNILQARGMTQQEAAATIATMGLATAEEGATATTWSLSGAFRALGTALAANPLGVISVGLMGLFSVMTALKNKTEEQAQAQAQLHEKTEQALVTYRQEVGKLDELITKYSELSAKSRDLEETREGLSQLQTQITDGYGNEANGIDLVNGKYSEQISKLYELKKAKAEMFITDQDNIDRYKASLKKLNEAGNINGNIDVQISDVGGISQDIINAWRQNGAIQDITKMSSFTDKGYGITLVNGNSAEEIYKTLESMAETYKELSTAAGNFNEDQYMALRQQAVAAKEAHDEAKEYVDLYSRFEDIANFQLTGDAEKRFNKLLDDAAELNQVLNGDSLPGDKYMAAKQLEDIKEQLDGIAGKNPELQSIINSTFATLEQGVNTSEGDIETLHDRWVEELEDVQAKSLKTVDAMSAALQKLSNGELLSHDEFWQIANLDENGILGMPQVVNGQYYVDPKQLAEFKDYFINAQIDILRERQATDKKMLLDLEAEKQKMLEQLKIQRAIIEAKAAGENVSRKDYNTAKAEIKKINDILAENEKSQKSYNRQVNNTTLLIEEWSSKLGDTVTVQIEANNAIKQFEAEIKAIDDTVDSLNNRKEVLQDEKSILQDQLNALNEQKKNIEDTIANYDKAGNAVSDLVQAQVEGIQSQLDALEEERKAIEDYYEEQLDSLKEQNEERDDAIEKEEALANLADAQSKKKRVYSSARGWTYESSKEDILNAQNALAKIATNEQIKALEKERDSKLGEFDDRKKDYESQIKSYQEYAKQYTSVADDIKKAENELLADQILGSEWREKIEQKDEGLLTKYRAQYTSFNEQLTNLTNNEIATLQASIDAKDAEIKKVDDEVKAYNRYKSTVQKSLADAKDALETYKNNMNTAKQDVIDAWEGMEHEGWDRSWKMESYNNKIASSAESARDRIVAAYRDVENALSMFDRFQDSPTGFGVINSAGDAELLRRLRNLGYYDNGGTNSYTGLAMLHGTPQRSETIFNANDSKKLYDMVHNTPNLLADIAKRAGTTNNSVNNSYANSISNTNNVNKSGVSIGQVVVKANNPKEFTQGLDREIDSYFRRKLTESYIK